jgi:hypothetical protein
MASHLSSSAWSAHQKQQRRLHKCIGGNRSNLDQVNFELRIALEQGGSRVASARQNSRRPHYNKNKDSNVTLLQGQARPNRGQTKSGIHARRVCAPPPALSRVGAKLFSMLYVFSSADQQRSLSI